MIFYFLKTFTSSIAEKFHQNRIKSKIFLNWHSLFVSRHKAKVEKACKKKAEEVCLDLAKQYQDKIKKVSPLTTIQQLLFNNIQKSSY